MTEESTLIKDGKPILLATTGEKLFKLSEFWHYRDGGNDWIVPRGFVYDLASVPAWLWFAQWGKFNNSAVAHDWIYVFGYLLKIDSDRFTKVEFSRSEADDLFKKMNRDLGVANFYVLGMWLAVRFFGWVYWKENKPEYGKSLEDLWQEYQKVKC